MDRLGILALLSEIDEEQKNIKENLRKIKREMHFDPENINRYYWLFGFHEDQFRYYFISGDRVLLRSSSQWTEQDVYNFRELNCFSKKKHAEYALEQNLSLYAKNDYLFREYYRELGVCEEDIDQLYEDIIIRHNIVKDRKSVV